MVPPSSSPPTRVTTKVLSEAVLGVYRDWVWRGGDGVRFKARYVVCEDAEYSTELVHEALKSLAMQVHQVHRCTHMKSCFRASDPNAPKEESCCRFNKPADVVDENEITDLGEVRFVSHPDDVWVNAAFRPLQLLTACNSDVKLIIAGDGSGAARVRYVTKYVAKAMQHNVFSNHACLVHAVLRSIDNKRQRDVADGKPRDKAAFEAATEQVRSRTAVGVGLSLANVLVRALQLDLAQVAWYVKYGEPYLCSHKFTTVELPVRVASLSKAKAKPATRSKRSSGATNKSASKRSKPLEHDGADVVEVGLHRVGGLWTTMSRYDEHLMRPDTLPFGDRSGVLDVRRMGFFEYCSRTFRRVLGASARRGARAASSGRRAEEEDGNVDGDDAVNGVLPVLDDGTRAVSQFSKKLPIAVFAIPESEFPRIVVIKGGFPRLNVPDQLTVHRASTRVCCAAGTNTCSLPSFASRMLRGESARRVAASSAAPAPPAPSSDSVPPVPPVPSVLSVPPVLPVPPLPPFPGTFAPISAPSNDFVSPPTFAPSASTPSASSASAPPMFATLPVFTDSGSPALAPSPASLTHLLLQSPSPSPDIWADRWSPPSWEDMAPRIDIASPPPHVPAGRFDTSSPAPVVPAPNVTDVRLSCEWLNDAMGVPPTPPAQNQQHLVATSTIPMDDVDLDSDSVVDVLDESRAAALDAYAYDTRALDDASGELEGDDAYQGAHLQLDPDRRLDDLYAALLPLLGETGSDPAALSELDPDRRFNNVRISDTDLLSSVPTGAPVVAPEPHASPSLSPIDTGLALFQLFFPHSHGDDLASVKVCPNETFLEAFNRFVLQRAPLGNSADRITHYGFGNRTLSTFARNVLHHVVDQEAADSFANRDALSDAASARLQRARVDNNEANRAADRARAQPRASSRFVRDDDNIADDDDDAHDAGHDARRAQDSAAFLDENAAMLLELEQDRAAPLVDASLALADRVLSHGEFREAVRTTSASVEGFRNAMLSASTHPNKDLVWKAATGTDSLEEDDDLYAAVDLNVTDDEPHQTTVRVEKSFEDLPPFCTIPEVIQHFELNDEQARIVALVCFVGRSTDPQNTADRALQLEHLRPLTARYGFDVERAMRIKRLRLFVHGPAGCGKSRVMDAVAAFFHSRALNMAVRSVSASGVAAVNINGVTMHSSARIPIRSAEHGRGAASAPASSSSSRRRSKPGPSSADLVAAFFGDCVALIMDEYSLTGKRLFHSFNQKVAAARGESATSDVAFGDIPVVVLCGDHLQMRPVRDSPIFAPSAPSVGATVKELRRDAADALVAQFTQVLQLTQVMRCKDDPRQLRLCAALRTRDGFTTDDVALINTRRISASTVLDRDADRATTTFLSYTNDQRVACERAHQRVRAQQSPASVYTWTRTDAPTADRNVPASVTRLFEATAHRNANVKCPPTAWAIAGMLIVITYNVDLTLGLANGTRARITNIYFSNETEFHDDPHGGRTASEIPVAIEVELDTPHSSTVGGSHTKRYLFPQRQYVTFQSYKFVYYAFPMRYGAVSTINSAQSQTFSGRVVLLDIFNWRSISGKTVRPPKEALYTAISRCTSLNNFFIDFEFTEAHARMCRPSVDDLEWQAEMDDRYNATLSEYFGAPRRAPVPRPWRDGATQVRARRPRAAASVPVPASTSWSVAPTRGSSSTTAESPAKRTRTRGAPAPQTSVVSREDPLSALSDFQVTQYLKSLHVPDVLVVGNQGSFLQNATPVPAPAMLVVAPTQVELPPDWANLICTRLQWPSLPRFVVRVALRAAHFFAFLLDRDAGTAFLFDSIPEYAAGHMELYADVLHNVDNTVHTWIPVRVAPQGLNEMCGGAVCRFAESLAHRVQDLVQHHALDAQVLEQMLHDAATVRNYEAMMVLVNSTVPRLAQVTEEELQQIALIP